MARSSMCVLRSSLVAFGIIALIPTTFAGPKVPVPRIVQPPDRFFQEGSNLAVVVGYDGANAGPSQRRSNMSIQLVVDGALIEQRILPSDGGLSTFQVPINSEDPISFVQVCIQPGSSGTDNRVCRRVRAAGIRDFDRVRRSLEEMNEIADAVMRYSITRLGYRGVPQSLEQLVPDFLNSVPSASPFSTPYEYTTTDEHFALRLVLPGSGEIRYEDDTFTNLPRGAITDREAARFTRQQLTELAQSAESYWVDNNQFPVRIEDLAPYYRRFIPSVDPYGHPYVFSFAPQAYVLTSLGKDGLPGGEGFDADTKVTNGMQLVATTPYRGRYEYLRRTFMDMSQIAGALSYFQEQTGTWPASLSELVGGPWFSWQRAFTDDCGNPYDYHVFDTGFGNREYRLRAFGCNGVSYTDPFEGLLYFSADTAGYVSAPGWRFAYRWPGLFD